MFIVGLVSGVMLATAGTAFGAPALQKISATLRPDYKVKVNGQEVKMQNAPISYNNTTYIPLREAGEILGYKVGFKDSTITLDKKDVNDVSAIASTELTGWVDLNTLARDYGVYVASGDDLTIGNITVKRPVAEPDRIETFQTEHGTIHVKIENGRFYVILEEMRNAGVIQ